MFFQVSQVAFLVPVAPITKTVVTVVPLLVAVALVVVLEHRATSAVVSSGLWIIVLCDLRVVIGMYR